VKARGGLAKSIPDDVAPEATYLVFEAASVPDISIPDYLTRYGCVFLALSCVSL